MYKITKIIKYYTCIAIINTKKNSSVTSWLINLKVDKPQVEEWLKRIPDNAVNKMLRMRVAKWDFLIFIDEKCDQWFYCLQWLAYATCDV